MIPFRFSDQLDNGVLLVGKIAGESVLVRVDSTQHHQQADNRDDGKRRANRDVAKQQVASQDANPHGADGRDWAATKSRQRHKANDRFSSDQEEQPAKN